MPLRVLFLKNLLLTALAFAPIPGVAVAASSSEQVLYSFGGKQGDGFYPLAAPINVGGILYGTTSEGGGNCNCGILYSLIPDGTETVLHQFAGGSDGASPTTGLLNVDGVLYGTTEIGGTFNKGTIYRLLRNGMEQVVHSFGGAPDDGAFPYSELINVNGVLYGTTGDGGVSDDGTVFSLTLDGTETVIHSFIGADGKSPPGPLLEMDGILYGTAIDGGSKYDGTVFSITPGGEFQVLHSFGTNAGDGKHPGAALINLNGTLYSTTEQGGSHKGGTVFSITPAGTEAVLFSLPHTGGMSQSTLVAVNEALIGTTDGKQQNAGSIFSVSTSGHGSLLFTFDGSNGAGPYSGLMKMGSALYGTTYDGGAYGVGTVYSFSH